jgi:hypothetical protein
MPNPTGKWFIMPDAQKIAELQNEIVTCFAKNVGEPWDFLLILFELSGPGAEAEGPLFLDLRADLSKIV